MSIVIILINIYWYLNILFDPNKILLWYNMQVYYSLLVYVIYDVMVIDLVSDLLYLPHITYEYFIYFSTYYQNPVEPILLFRPSI